MKKLLLLTAISAVYTMAGIQAQTGQWKLAGNALTGTEKFGSTNGLDVNMVANNTTLMTLKPNGRIGFGNTNPLAKFNFTGLVRIDDSIGVSLLPLMILNGRSNNATIELRTNDTLKTIFGYDQSGNSFNINVTSPYVSSFAVNRGTGDVLIGSQFTPAAKITLDNSSTVKGDFTVAGTNGLGDMFFTYYQQGIRFPTFGPTNDNSAMIYMTDATTTNARMVLAHSKAFSNWGLQYDDATDQFNFLGNGSNKMAINLNNGRIGLGVAAPAYKLDVSGTSRFIGNVGIQTVPNTRTLQIGSTQGSLVGIGTGEYIQDGGTSTLSASADWVPVTDNVYSIGNSSFRWQDVWAVDGTINTSDMRDKKNIKDLNYGLREIMQLHPVSFNWKRGIDNGTKLGVIAQEIQKVLPEVVRDYDIVTDEETGKQTKVPSERLGVMYSDIIPVLINAIQQQQKEIEELKETVQQLSGSNQVSGLSGQVSGASALEGAKPNPVTSSAVISYKASGKNIQLVFTDVNGNIVKQMQVNSAAGSITVDCSNMSSGTYSYSLIADGKIIDTKKLVVAK